MVKDGRQKAFVREYGHGAFGYAERNPKYARVFNQDMSIYSSIYTQWVLEAFGGYDFSNIQLLGEVGGGSGTYAFAFPCKIFPPKRDHVGIRVCNPE